MEDKKEEFINKWRDGGINTDKFYQLKLSYWTGLMKEKQRIFRKTNNIVSTKNNNESIDCSFHL